MRAAAERIRGRVLRTPVRHSPWLSRVSGGTVLLKLETLQPTHSYKLRGATNAVRRLLDRGDSGSIVTASAGNHGRAMAHAAAEAGVPLTVYAPAKAPRTKLEAIRALGATLCLADDYDEAERQAKGHAAAGDAVYVSPYAHPDVIAGAGTVALEIREDVPEVDVVVASIGGGGLISGIAIALEGQAEAAGVEVEASTPFTTSLAAGRITTIDVRETLADGLSGNLDPDTPTFAIVRDQVSRIAVVSEAEVKTAIRDVATHERLIVEGATAAAVAAVASGRFTLTGRTAVIVLSGANIDLDVLRGLLSS